jgi:hypothetical protein
MDCEDHHMALGFLFFSVCYGTSITWHLKPILGIVLDLDEANFDTFFPVMSTVIFILGWTQTLSCLSIFHDHPYLSFWQSISVMFLSNLSGSKS